MPHLARSQKKTIFATAIGACLEWYDFSIYMFVTPMITANFFPKDNKIVALISAFAIFAAGYLMRPLAGIFFGNLGDKIGRKKVLAMTTGLMCIPMLGTAVLPTYHQWGIYSVIVLLLLRMAQGFSVGGEYTGVLVMLLEQAPDKRRALITSTASILSGLGVLLSLATVTLLNHTLGNAKMMIWGWRIPFFIGFLIALFAYKLQDSIKESPYYDQVKKEKKISSQPFLAAYRNHFKSIMYVIALAGFLGIPCYLALSYIPNYLINIRHFQKQSVFDAQTLATMIYLFFIPISALISDWYGRKPVLYTTTALFIVMSYPVFTLIAHGTLFMAYLGVTLMLAVYGAEAAVFVTAINELFPTEERYSGVSMGYNIGNALFGGTTPLVSMYLVKVSQNPLAPAWYLTFGATITMVLLFTLPETYQRRRSKIGMKNKIQKIIKRQVEATQQFIQLHQKSD